MRSVFAVSFAAGILVLAGGLARADVSSYSATASSSIVQYLNGDEQNRDDQSLTYPGSASSMPLEISHELAGTGAVNYTAYNRVLTNDPQYNAAVPRDFIMETAIGSAADGVSLGVRSQASQTRTLNLLSSEFPRRQTGDVVKLRSTFDLEGALCAVLPETAASPEGLTVKMNLSVSKGNGNVWKGGVEMTGKHNGNVATTTTGQFHNTDFTVLQNQVPGLGTIWLVVFGQTPLSYTYTGKVGESFDLTAALDFEYSVPAGLGAGCAFGTVPERMIALSESMFGQTADSLAAKQLSPAPEPASLILMVVGAGILARKR